MMKTCFLSGKRVDDLNLWQACPKMNQESSSSVPFPRHDGESGKPPNIFKNLCFEILIGSSSQQEIPRVATRPLSCLVPGEAKRQVVKIRQAGLQMTLLPQLRF